MYRKAYVSVTAKFEKDGSIIPRTILWENGIIYKIDKITNICLAASMKAGGSGIRYTCLINGNLTYLFLEKDRWFVEAKNTESETVKNNIGS